MNPRDNQRDQILEELESSRRQLDTDLEDLGHAVNVRERMVDSVRQNPGWWIGGALAGGFLLAALTRAPSRDRKGKKGGDESVAQLARQSLFLGLIGSAGKQILRVAEPVLVQYAKQEIERFVSPRGNETAPPENYPPS